MESWLPEQALVLGRKIFINESILLKEGEEKFFGTHAKLFVKLLKHFDGSFYAKYVSRKRRKYKERSSLVSYEPGYHWVR